MKPTPSDQVSEKPHSRMCTCFVCQPTRAPSVVVNAYPGEPGKEPAPALSPKARRLKQLEGEIATGILDLLIVGQQPPTAETLREVGGHACECDVRAHQTAARGALRMSAPVECVTSPVFGQCDYAAFSWRRQTERLAALDVGRCTAGPCTTTRIWLVVARWHLRREWLARLVEASQ